MLEAEPVVVDVLGGAAPLLPAPLLRVVPVVLPRLLRLHTRVARPGVGSGVALWFNRGMDLKL